ncbi:MAG: hypothetical protein A4E66_01858 [Syntrophus sp. PtaB.Bin001]|nr:MAG: hypothetical protein A4E66_01858 [Syntrophus sp. PtaB.Bin001]
MGLFADKQSGIGRKETSLLQTFNFLNKDLRINHEPIADDANLVIVKYAGRNQMKNRLFAFDDECMTGIVATLKSCDDLCVFRVSVNDLSFALITPLGSHNYNIGHNG